jgi:hypothetical protein
LIGEFVSQSRKQMKMSELFHVNLRYIPDRMNRWDKARTKLRRKGRNR